jgi:hypothetical protein
VKRWPLLLLVAGCQPVNSPVMTPGEDCLSCHQQDDNRRHFSVGGTIFFAPDSADDEGLEGAEIHVTDKNGKQLTLRSNSAGNFYTAEDVAFPLTLEAQFKNRRLAMQTPAESGACNTCHAREPQDDAPGRLFVQ